jgi:hypothetical protein
MPKYEYAFFSLHEMDAADEINRAGAEGFKFAGTASDVVILTRECRSKSESGGPRTTAAHRQRNKSQ